MQMLLYIHLNLLQPDPDKLEKIVEDLRKTHQEAKLKAKGLSAQNNQANLSPASQICKYLIMF